MATGKRVSQERVGTEQVSHYVSERPMPVAGFNLGRYSMASATAAGNVRVEAYATGGMERTFRRGAGSGRRARAAGARPRTWVRSSSPARRSRAGQQRGSRGPALGPRDGFFCAKLRTISLQFAGAVADARARQPGLARPDLPLELCLSLAGRAAGSAHERRGFAQLQRLHAGARNGAPVVGRPGGMERTYRDQWLVEALASYSAILAYEKDRPADCKQVAAQLPGSHCCPRTPRARSTRAPDR